jgi:large-conductance mechanosensitive channel
MADDKKAAPPSGGGWDWVDFAGLAILVIAAIEVLRRIWNAITLRVDVPATPDAAFDVAEQGIANFSVYSAFPVFSTLALIISFILLALCVYFLMKINSLMDKLKAREDTPATEDIKIREPIEIKTRQNERWEEVQNLVRSNSESMWRLAILEADILLGEMLDTLGYSGEDIGEKLKAATRNEFETLDRAWEAHKVRNKIAHEGSEYALTHAEANRVVGLYQEVFEEFKFI